MRWLEDYRDETERRVREALDVAVLRNDDLSLRRVWSRLADLVPMTPGLRGRLRWSFLLTVGALVGGVVAGAVLLRPLLEEAPHRPPGTVATATPAPRQTPAIEVRPAAPPPAVASQEDPIPLLVGPTEVHAGSQQERTVRLMSGARVDLRAQSTLSVDAGQRPNLRQGRARLDVPKQPRGKPFSVAVGPYVVVVVGTKFSLGVSSREVQVEVREGLVEVWRGRHVTRLVAGDVWKGPTQRRSLASRRQSLALIPGPGQPRLEGKQHPSDGYQEAMAALNRGDTMIALSLLRQAARDAGPAAENAGFAIGTVLRDHVYQPRQAVDAWRAYRERHPDGLLRQETDVSIIETLLELGDRAAARLEVEAFLRLHPGSEWYGQMASLAAKLAHIPAESAEPARQDTKRDTKSDTNDGPKDGAKDGLTGAGRGAARGTGGPSAMRAP